MAKIISNRRTVRECIVYREFDSKETDLGFMFDYNNDDNPILGTELAKANYDYCLAHPELFIDKGFNIREKYIIEPAKAICECGKKIELTDDYCGASECPHCGQWHNLFGQQLKHPDCWEEPIDIEY